MAGKKIKRACDYCLNFYNASIRNSKSIEENRQIYLLRHCPIQNKEVNEDTEACNEFSLTKFFFCNKNEYWLHTLVCIYRIETKVEGCSRCKQGKLIKQLMESK